ncbi:MAG: LysE family translocator [Comamonas sp.]|jgi:threonine/homoserine/homoserine lactone efflux protein|uniref:LysE family translocator n=1 Tax=Comamonas sp. TaxID=34028 RepID=UPI00281977DA|nr:LysE family translocator [Comamonas sp.]MDR0212944.1 LysE family translocator [Comamonas sp.]MDR2298299.1 LysE family translocator [Comamonas sp.]
MNVNDWSFLLVIATILLTPGPTNTLLASSGISQGLRRSAPLLSFECLGYVCATSLWGLVLNTTMHDYPFVINIIKVVSGLYIAKLGLRLWYQSRRDPLQELLVSVKPLELFIATLLNPKAVIFAMALFPVQTWLSVSNYAGVMGSFVLLVASIGGLWIVFGSVLMAGRVRWLQPQVFQRLAALTLWGFSIWLLANGIFF